MPLSTTAKAVLCLCPPAMMAGTVATVPAAKRAVHHLTAPHRVPAHAQPTAVHAVAQPDAQARERVDCDPLEPGALPAVPLVTYAAPIPDEPGGTASGVGGGAPGAIAALATGGGVAPIVSPTPVAPVVTGAVPEPGTWLMLIGGVGVLGLALRRRRDGRGKGSGARATIGAALWSGGIAVDAGELAATAAVRSTVAAKTTAAGIAGKALLCVCPAVVVAGSVMTVPPLRHAVHAATAMPAVATPAAPVGLQAARPCDAPMTVPVSTAAVDGFPPSVDTVPTPAARPALGTTAAPTI